MHCTREPNAPSTEPATARANTVFAVPGTSSNNTCPPHINAANTNRTSSRFPCTTNSTFATKLSAVALAASNQSVSVIVFL